MVRERVRVRVWVIPPLGAAEREAEVAELHLV